MTTKIKPVPPSARAVPTIPGKVSTPAFQTYSKSDVRPSFQTRAELISRVAAGEVFDVGGVASNKNSQVVAVINNLGIVTATVEVVEGVITQVL